MYDLRLLLYYVNHLPEIKYLIFKRVDLNSLSILLEFLKNNYYNLNNNTYCITCRNGLDPGYP